MKLPSYQTLLQLGLTIFIGFLSFSTQASLPFERHTLPLPKLDNSYLSPAPTHQKSEPHNWTLHTIKIPKFGSLSGALDSAGIRKGVLFQINKIPHSNLLTQLQVGDTLKIWTNDHDDLMKIVYPKNHSTTYQLDSVKDGFKIKIIKKKTDIKVVSTSGEIKHSFYLSGKAAGLSAKTIMALADIFSWEIDFIRQLRPGDPFKVIYEKKYIDGNYIGDGRILAAEVTTNHGIKHSAFLLTDKNNKTIGYYNAKKRNLRKAFLRNPVDYVRITSRYKPKRYHPVLKKWRAHRGVDYGGPVGTPIHATGDGQIIRRGWSKSYGRVIYIKHAGKYTTVYAHMSRFGKYKKYQWVKQGNIIGYIGSSGLATGPHLHYEFRKNGRHIDPLKVKFPDAGPVPKKYRAKFIKFSTLMSAQLDRLSTKTKLAKNFE